MYVLLTISHWARYLCCRASVDSLCRDGSSEVARHPRSQRLQTRWKWLAKPNQAKITDGPIFIFWYCQKYRTCLYFFSREIARTRFLDFYSSSSGFFFSRPTIPLPKIVEALIFSLNISRFARGRTSSDHYSLLRLYSRSWSLHGKDSEHKLSMRGGGIGLARRVRIRLLNSWHADSELPWWNFAFSWTFPCHCFLRHCISALCFCSFVTSEAECLISAFMHSEGYGNCRVCPSVLLSLTSRVMDCSTGRKL